MYIYSSNLFLKEKIMISFIVCAFNEEDNIEDTVVSIREAIETSGFSENYEVVIINDGSKDKTKEVILSLKKNLQHHIFTKSQNLGYGQSLIKGLDSVNYDKFMVIPGDNDLPKETIKIGLKNMNKADLVMLFPINTDNRSKVRNVVSIIFNLMYLIFFDTYVNYINAPAVYPTKIVRNLKLKSNRFSIISEMITKLLHSDVTYCEIPAFFASSLRKRRTVTLKNFIDVVSSFIKIYIDIKITNKKQFLKKSTRINIY